MSPSDADANWMALALAEADAAESTGDIPVGCVIVARDGVVVARGRNRREATKDPTAHAEIVALRAASEAIGTWRLDGATMYVTLEPCTMCAGALVLARIARVVYGCDDPKGGAIESLFRVGRDERLNHRFEVTRGVLAHESAARLRAFFAALRAQGKK